MIDEYRHMRKMLNSIQPSTVEIATAARRAKEPDMSERLRRNRAARLATTDRTAVNHISNVYHMYK